MVDVENSSRMTVSTASGEDTNVSSFVNQGMPLSVTVPPPKKRRNLPGMPDPDAEVVALSPHFLLATNRFGCEICNKGFQRDQNLQLHRRGHNQPWKLKQRTDKEPRKRVYVCPEPSCVHHNPVRALGDLTGIKKHFSRKHGEKKWKCERCSKEYVTRAFKETRTWAFKEAFKETRTWAFKEAFKETRTWAFKEICNKGFQRDQNLQLHRRGHNLPWKLKQRTDKEPRKRVYVCPEPSCVHHNPVRALGDLTGIKKHFSRKHGEKKWKCERCSKEYAVQSDCKAHMKTCGTREYKCDCGTLFSRRDSFITHRPFCDALTGKEGDGYNIKCVVTSPPPPPLTPSTSVVSPGLSVQSSELAENPIGLSPPTPVATCLDASATSTSSTSSTSNVFASIFASSTAPPAAIPRRASPPSAFPMFCGLARSDCPPTMPARGATEPPSLSLSTSVYLSNTLSFPFPADQDHRHYTPSPQPAMSATALLQKAAQMGATTSNPSFLCGLGLPPSTNEDGNGNQWDRMPDNKTTFAAGLGLVLPSCDVMMNSFSLLGNKPTTLDLLGLGMDAASSALINSYGTGGFNVGEAAAAAAAAYGGGGRGNSEESWDGVPERKPNGSAASSLKSSI